MLLEQYDADRRAVINPEDIYGHPKKGFPKTVVSVFSYVLFNEVLKALGGKVIFKSHDADGEWPVYEVVYGGRRFAFAKARVGAPACVGYFEDIISQKSERIIVAGNCGVLDASIADCGIIIPTAAIRDEGTSYHYAPPSDKIDVNKKYIPEFERVLDRAGYPHVKGTVWTTDAFYRETREKVARRKAAGAVCVDMECSAMQAMCDHRGVEYFQFFYAGDNLDHGSWEPRSLSGAARLDDKVKIALLAFELAVEIENELSLQQ